jgi:hypothetical protein
VMTILFLVFLYYVLGFPIVKKCYSHRIDDSARLLFNNRVIWARIVHRRLNPTTTAPKLTGTGCLNNFFFYPRQYSSNRIIVVYKVLNCLTKNWTELTLPSCFRWMEVKCPRRSESWRRRWPCCGRASGRWCCTAVISGRKAWRKRPDIQPELTSVACQDPRPVDL